MRAYSITDTGILRTMNQDYYFTADSPVGNLPNLFIVADGMGGHKAGEYASRHTTERVVASASRNRYKSPVRILREAIEKANQILVKEAEVDESKAGMGPTIVAATIDKNKLCVANVGDSRLYVVGDTITQITKDHSYVEEMVRRGGMKPELARVHPDKNIITRAIGATDTVEPDFFEIDLKEDEVILMCSDGLTNMVTDERIAQIVRQEYDLKDVAKRLVEEANKNGGLDNITIVLIHPGYQEVKEC